MHARSFPSFVDACSWECVCVSSMDERIYGN